MVQTAYLEVQKISMLIGFNLNDETFGDYARVKAFRSKSMSTTAAWILWRPVEQRRSSSKTRWNLQTKDVGVGVESERGGKYKITVTDIYPERTTPLLP